MNQISQYFLNVRNKAASKQNKSLRYALNYDRAEYIGILYYDVEGNKSNVLNNLFSQLRTDKKKVEVLRYVPEITSKIPLESNFDIFSNKDINLTGAIQSSIVDNFINQPFDYLFSINLQEATVLDFILSNSQAKLRIGKYFKGSEKYLDLMLNTQEDGNISYLVDLMLLYCKKLGNKTN